jgi:hypothetical protein
VLGYVLDSIEVESGSATVSSEFDIEALKSVKALNFLQG